VRAWATPGAVRAFRSDLAAGAYLVEWWPAAAAESADIAERYSDLALSLADASLTALAARYGTVTIATFDERHFRVIRPLTGEPAFRLLPLDA
jgi:predicted nucleic acid-binding protein